MLHLVILITAFALPTNSWDYDNVAEWPGTCQKGKRQSPINLYGGRAFEKHFLPLTFKDYNKDYSARLEHAVHTVKVILNTEDTVPMFSGGNYRGEYVLDHLHFHWQSEHTFDRKRYPMEVHFVHHNAKYDNISEALDDPEGLGVFAVLFDLSPDPKEELDPVTEVLTLIASKPNATIELKQMLNPHDLLPCDRAGYYTYPGSLTTPGCEEVVTWTVFTAKMPISDSQVKLFENLDTGHGSLITNYRPIQTTHRRKVLFRQSPISAASTIFVAPILTLLTIMLCSFN